MNLTERTMSTEFCLHEEPAVARHDVSEAFLRRWPRRLLLAYVVGMGSVAIGIAVQSWLGQSSTVAFASQSVGLSAVDRNP